MVEFSGGKIKPPHSSKLVEHMQRMLEAIKQSKTHYSKKCGHPKSRKLRKFAQAANLNSTNTSDEGPEVTEEVDNFEQPDFSVEGKGEDKKWKR